MKLTTDLRTSVIAIVLMTVVLGIAYPLVITGVAQVVAPGKADGSLVAVGGKVVGSRLIARASSAAADFQPRPSATGYSASATSFANRGPNSAAARFFYRDQLAAYLERNGAYDPGLARAGVPVDAVTASASGVDPDISQANAAIQARRVAAMRKLPLARVQQLVRDHTDGRFLGLIGEPGVNVLELNLALPR